MSSSVSEWLRKKMRRRTVNLGLSPGIQLRLPLALCLVTLCFLGTLVMLAEWGFRDWFEAFMANEPPRVRAVLSGHTTSFLQIGGLATLAYMGTIFGVALAFSHRLLGPTVALRRQLEAMKDGDYSTRVHLREGDALRDLACDLNELADTLEMQKSDLQGPGTP